MYVGNPLLHNNFSKRIYPGSTRPLTKSTRAQSTRVRSRDLVAIKQAIYRSQICLKVLTNKRFFTFLFCVSVNPLYTFSRFFGSTVCLMPDYQLKRSFNK